MKMIIMNKPQEMKNVFKKRLSPKIREVSIH